MYYHYLWYLLLNCSRSTIPKKVITHSLKSPEDVLMRRPATYFCKSLKQIGVSKLPKILNYIQYSLLFVTRVQYNTNKMMANSLRSPEDVPMRSPATYFFKVLSRLATQNLPKTLNHVQCRLLFVTSYNIM